jgi:hypothetical protein
MEKLIQNLEEDFDLDLHEFETALIKPSTVSDGPDSEPDNCYTDKK